MSIVWYAQSKEHPSDPMYAKVFVCLDAADAALADTRDDYIVFRYDTDDGSCRVVRFP